MKTLFVLSTLIVLAAPAVAREAFKGFRCDNECPLAQQANSHRSTGNEALSTSNVVRADVVAAVEKNLMRI